MSDQEQDAVVGRLVRDSANAKRKAAAMKTELEEIAKELVALVNALHHNIHSDVQLVAARRHIHDGLLAGYDFSKLIAFLEEYTEVRKSIEHMERRLLELGVT